MVSLQKDLVGHWTMDSKDLSDGLMADRSSYDHHAHLRGSPTFNNKSPLGNGGDFIESDGDYLPIQDKFYTEVEQIPEITISVWFKCTNGGDYIIQYDRSEFFRCTTDVWVTNSDASGGTSDMVFNAPTDGNWHHVVYWYDSDASGTRKRVYIDNQLDTELSDPHNGTGLGADLTRYGEIAAFGESGSFDSTQSPRFTGQMSDLRLYERAISEDEISALYNMRSQRQQNTNGANVEDLVLHLNARDKRSVDESNSRWKDISGNGNEAHGTSGNGSIDDNVFPNWEPVNGGRFILNGNEGFNVPGPVETTGQVSLESWFKRTDISDDTQYLSDARNGSGNWHLTNYVGYNINFGNNLKANDPSGTDYQQSGSAASPDSNFFNKWTHLVATSDDTTSQLFIDGQQITDDRLRTSSPFQTGIGQDFAIANRYTGSSHLQGYISVYRIYDRVLSPAQVQANYESERRFYE